MQKRERRKEGATMLDLDQVIRERHSTRMFLSNRPVPRELMDEALILAQCAPSNSNIQPWHMVFASGPSRDRLVAALLDEARRRPPNIPPLPDSFVHFRRELGAQVYGAMGIGIQDKVGHDAAVLRNWEFFRAQLAIPAELSILCGLAIGYPDPDFPANKLHIGREAIGKNVVFLES